MRQQQLVREEVYGRWIARNEPGLDELDDQRAQALSLPEAPLISILTPVCDPPPAILRDTIASVLAQTYPHWQLCLADGGSTQPGVREVLVASAEQDSRIQVTFLPENRGIAGNTNAALDDARGDYIALLDHDDLLAPNHLFEVAAQIREHPDADLIYFDEDKISADGVRRLAPNFKPHHFSPVYLRSANYLMHSVLRRALVQEVGRFDPKTDGAQDWDLALRITERTHRIHHIGKVLYHWRQIAGSTALEPEGKPYALQAQARCLENHHRRTTDSATGTPATGTLPRNAGRAARLVVGGLLLAAGLALAWKGRGKGVGWFVQTPLYAFRLLRRGWPAVPNLPLLRGLVRLGLWPSGAAYDRRTRRLNLSQLQCSLWHDDAQGLMAEIEGLILPVGSRQDLMIALDVLTNRPYDFLLKSPLRRAGGILGHWNEHRGGGASVRASPGSGRRLRL